MKTRGAVLAASAWLVVVAEAAAGQGQSLPLNPDIEGPGFIRGPAAAELNRDAEELIDGRLHIPGGARPPNAQAIHQRMCQALDAQDVTDAVDMVLAARTLDAAVCLGATKALMPAPTVVPVPGDRFGALNYPVALPLVVRPVSAPLPVPLWLPVQIIPHASVGSVPIRNNYVAVAGTEFLGAMGVASYDLAASAEGAGCGWRARGTLLPDDGVLLFGYALCTADLMPQVVSTELSACLGHDCSTAVGVLRYYD